MGHLFFECELRGQFLFQMGKIFYSQMLGYDFAVAGDDDVGGKAEDSSVAGGDLLASDDDGVVDVELVTELIDGASVVIHGDTDDLQALIAVLGLPLDEAGDFLAAGRAPGGEEIEQNDFAGVV